MKKEWKIRWKRLGAMFLLAVLLAQTAGMHLGTVVPEVVAAEYVENEESSGNVGHPEVPEMERQELGEQKSEDQETEDWEADAQKSEDFEPEDFEPEDSEKQVRETEEDLNLEDSDAIIAWFEEECEGSFLILAEKDEAWWEALTPNERTAAELFASFLLEEEEIDHYTFEDLEGAIARLEEGADPDVFFAGTHFEGLQLEDLYCLQKYGYTLDDLFYFMEAIYQPEEYKSGLYDRYQALQSEEEEPSGEEREGLEALYNLAEQILPLDYWGIQMLWNPGPGDPYASMSVSRTGYGANGNSTGLFGEHGEIWKLKVGGVDGFCGTYGASARNGFKYGNLSEAKSGRIGWITQVYATSSGSNFAAAQIVIWCLQRGITDRNQAGAAAYAIVKNTVSDSSANLVKAFAINIMNSSLEKSGTYYTMEGPTGSQIPILPSQPSLTPYNPEEPEPIPGGAEPEYGSVEDSVSVEYGVKVRKEDWQTGVGLQGCRVDIFENGNRIATVDTDQNGEASYVVTKSASFQASYCSNYGDLTPEQQAGIEGHTSLDAAVADLEAQKADFAATRYTYSTYEVKAPEGYVWEANEQSQSIAGNETANLLLTNERTLGSAELVKYDTEAEGGAMQGDASLDGAVYGIYAKTDIFHQDRKTGVVNRDGIFWKKDQLIQTQTVGRTPKRDPNGYLLNTDGSRHIANPKGTVAYESTPGRTMFCDLELGQYYIREITPSEGYMLDEAIYDVTFTYHDQMVKVEVRDEAARDADNELTVDDNSGSKTVYSGDYVVKQGIQFVKTSDNAYQTELRPVEGAGFSVYRIRELSGVRNGSVVPLNGAWGSDDIMTFYNYDFTNEERATLYKRTGHEEWTAGDQKWLNSLGGNRYQVMEMFTDADGRIETPELPYGTYVMVETTTPEHHVMAKPFIVQITQDGGVLYTDSTKQVIEKGYTPEEGIRYGDHPEAKEREGRVLQKQRIVNNTITQAFLRLVKADEEFLVQPGAYISAEEAVRGTVLKEGAQYRLRCTSIDLSEESLLALNWKYDAKGYLSYYAPGTKEVTGTEEHPFTTSFLRKDGKIADCYITLPRELPVGTYELTELTAPTGYVVNGSEQAVQNTGSGRVNGYKIVDRPAAKMVFTIDNGAVYPDGQMGLHKYALHDEYGNLIVTVLQKNQEQKGIIEIYKHGEQVTGTTRSNKILLDKLKEDTFRALKLEKEARHTDLNFIYEDAPVEGAVFHIVANEDIYTQELNPALVDRYQVNREDYRIYRKGDVVATIMTDRNGWGYASGLYIGKYKIVEVTAGSGFVLNTTQTEFEITPQDQTVSFDIHTADYRNERQRLEISVEKTDAQSKEPLAGAVFGLYAAEDILTWMEYKEEDGTWILREEPKILAAKGELIATCVTDQNGRAAFDGDLPLAKYEVRELEAPVGYVSSAEEILVDGSYTGEKGGQTVEIQRHQASFANTLTEAQISKQELTGGKELPGARLEVYEAVVDEKGELPDKDQVDTAEKKDSWISGETPHVIRGLQIGRIYVLRETKPAEGYVSAEEILFRLVQEKKEDGTWSETVSMYSLDGTEWRQTEDNLLVMQDDVTKVQISKKDFATKEELPGAHLELYSESGELLDEWISKEEPHYIEKLPIGKYRLVERIAPYGYGYAEDVSFEVRDDGGIQTVEMWDDVQKVEVEKSTISLTQSGDVYKNTVDCVKNKTDARLDHFTLTDRLPEQVWLTELWTGTYNQELSYRVEYQTNGSDTWVLWAEGLDTRINHHLEAPQEWDSEEKHISAFRICFGTVEGRFEQEIGPAYLVRVRSIASGTLLNQIELFGEQDGIPHRDRDETTTRVFFRSMRGYAPKGVGEPAYEIVDVLEPDLKVSVEEKVERIRREREMQITEGGLTAVPTGDMEAPVRWLCLAAAAVVGLTVCLVWRRRKKKPDKI